MTIPTKWAWFEGSSIILSSYGRKYWPENCDFKKSAGGGDQTCTKSSEILHTSFFYDFTLRKNWARGNSKNFPKRNTPGLISRNPFIRTSIQTFPGIRNWYSHFGFFLRNFEYSKADTKKLDIWFEAKFIPSEPLN